MKLTREEILAKLRTILVEQLSIIPDAVTPETYIGNPCYGGGHAGSPTLGADSLAQIEIIMAIEDEFGININDDEAEQIKTVGQAIDHIEHALA